MSTFVPPPGEHGGDGPALAAALGCPVDQILDLSQSLNPFAPDPIPAVRRAADAVRQYPDVALGEALLAAAMGIDAERLVLANGGSEAIALVATEVPAATIVEPEFSLYARHTAVAAGAPRWRSNPNNPLGHLAAPDDHAGVWDEAFWPLATGTWTRGDADHGSWVAGSLTKLLACPGLRIGYLIAPTPAAATRIRGIRPVWSVNSVALVALPDLLAPVDLPAWHDAIRRARSDLVHALGVHHLDVRASDAPWVLVQAPGHLRERLAQHGILVRDCASFGLDAVRIAVPHPRDLDRLAAALASQPLPQDSP
jgi:histidinol-phosphate/aromatic aminotransferase/cobyric acid decarboxylase-like protein